MTENEALNWKTKAIAYETALYRLESLFDKHPDLKDSYLDTVKRAIEYIHIWHRK